MRRRAIAGIAVAALWCLGASAEVWPSKPVRIVTAFGAGSASDIVARTLADELQRVFAQPFIVDNKPGASGIIAAEQVARSAPDGYTLFLSTNTAHSANPFLFKKLPYDPLKDFTPIARVCYFPFVLAVNASIPVKTVPELIAYAHEPGHKLSYGYGNSTGQVAGAAFNSLAKLDATAVPYKSTPQALTDLIGNQIGFLFVDLASSQAHLKSNRLRALAVTTERRSKLAPELPTIADSARLPGFDLAAWVGVLAPAGLPKDITDRLSVEITRALASPKIFDKLTALGAEVAPGSASELRSTMDQQLEVWGRKVKESGIEAE
ncbi:Bug family tripartite tricarboxylate transporter substrate binding protein [Variovorax sp. GT1P44]|uniref:Bug family tripartite tricarboxylate transporter substrate binding protein n=1 Tax=Variovorax sp. GT1P44 TaxID=3443742 RepID=UPI003F483C27